MNEGYEGFSNYTTWFVCSIIDNHKPMYDKMMKGLAVVTRRFKGGNPNKCSFPFITHTHGGFNSTPIMHLVNRDIRREVNQYPYKNHVVQTTGVTFHLTFAYDVLDWAFETMSEELEDSPLNRSEIVNQEVCDHLVAMHLESLWGTECYAWELTHGEAD